MIDMKTTKHIILAIALLVSAFLKVQATENDELVWHTDIMKANEISKASKKPIFAFFTGSDWCGWCHKLQREVLTKPEFIKWAKENVVLVELDFPRGKTLAPELVQQNTGLQQALQVQGFPTIWLFFLSKNAEGTGFNIEALGTLGYPQGATPGKEELKFISDANSVIAKKK